MSSSLLMTLSVSLVVLFSGTWVLHAKASNSPKTIAVVTVTSDGQHVDAVIRVKTYADGEKDAFILRREGDADIISVEKCDEQVSITAKAKAYGVVRKVDSGIPDWLPCTEPKVTINDFVVEPLTAAASNPIFQTEDYWGETLGAETVKMNPQLPKDIASAFVNKEYGKISIIATELQKALRQAGKENEANLFYSLSIDAAARGVLAKTGKPFDPQTTDILEYSPASGRFELKSAIKSTVEQYQMDKLDYEPSYKQLGKLDWQTMESLQGGDDTHAPLYQLNPNEAKGFNDSLMRNELGGGAMNGAQF